MAQLEVSVTRTRNLTGSELILKNLTSTIAVGQQKVTSDNLFHESKVGVRTVFAARPQLLQESLHLQIQNRQTNTVMYVRSIPLRAVYDHCSQINGPYVQWLAVYTPGDPTGDLQFEPRQHAEDHDPQVYISLKILSPGVAAPGGGYGALTNAAGVVPGGAVLQQGSGVLAAGGGGGHQMSQPHPPAQTQTQRTPHSPAGNVRNAPGSPPQSSELLSNNYRGPAYLVENSGGRGTRPGQTSAALRDSSLLSSGAGGPGAGSNHPQSTPSLQKSKPGGPPVNDADLSEAKWMANHIQRHMAQAGSNAAHADRLARDLELARKENQSLKSELQLEKQNTALSMKSANAEVVQQRRALTAQLQETKYGLDQTVSRLTSMKEEELGRAKREEQERLAAKEEELQKQRDEFDYRIQTLEAHLKHRDGQVREWESHFLEAQHKNDLERTKAETFRVQLAEAKESHRISSTVVRCGAFQNLKLTTQRVLDDGAERVRQLEESLRKERLQARATLESVRQQKEHELEQTRLQGDAALAETKRQWEQERQAQVEKEREDWRVHTKSRLERELEGERTSWKAERQKMLGEQTALLREKESAHDAELARIRDEARQTADKKAGTLQADFEAQSERRTREWALERAKLADEVRNMEATIAALRAEKDSQVAQKDEAYQQELTAKQTQIHEMRQRFATQEAAKVAAVEDAKRSTREQVERVADERVERTAREKEAALQEQHSAELRKRDEYLDHLERQLDDSNREIDNWKRSSAELEASVAGLQSEFETLREEKMSATEALSRQVSELQAAQAREQNSKRQAEEKVAALTQTLEELRKQLEEQKVLEQEGAVAAGDGRAEARQAKDIDQFPAEQLLEVRAEMEERFHRMLETDKEVIAAKEEQVTALMDEKAKMEADIEAYETAGADFDHQMWEKEEENNMLKRFIRDNISHGSEEVGIAELLQGLGVQLNNGGDNDGNSGAAIKKTRFEVAGSPPSAAQLQPNSSPGPTPQLPQSQPLGFGGVGTSVPPTRLTMNRPSGPALGFSPFRFGVAPLAPVVQTPLYNQHKGLLGQPSRKRKALIVGCDYAGTRNAGVDGAIADAVALSNFWTQTRFFDDVRTLTDASSDRSQSTIPTGVGGGASRAANLQDIVDGLDWLVADVTPEHHLFFFFAGYGACTREPSGLDSALLPADFAANLPQGFTVDPEWREAPDKHYDYAKPGLRVLTISDLFRGWIQNAPCRCTVIVDAACAQFPSAATSSRGSAIASFFQPSARVKPDANALLPAPSPAGPERAGSHRPYRHLPVPPFPVLPVMAACGERLSSGAPARHSPPNAAYGEPESTGILTGALLRALAGASEEEALSTVAAACGDAVFLQTDNSADACFY
eukprot:g1389.t1